MNNENKPTTTTCNNMIESPNRKKETRHKSARIAAYFYLYKEQKVNEHNQVKFLGVRSTAAMSLFLDLRCWIHSICK